MEMKGLKLGLSPYTYVRDINSTFFNYKISFGGAYKFTNDLILGASIDYSIAQMSSINIAKSDEGMKTQELIPDGS